MAETSENIRQKSKKQKRIIKEMKDDLVRYDALFNEHSERLSDLANKYNEHDRLIREYFNNNSRRRDRNLEVNLLSYNFFFPLFIS